MKCAHLVLLLPLWSLCRISLWLPVLKCSVPRSFVLGPPLSKAHSAFNVSCSPKCQQSPNLCLWSAPGHLHLLTWHLHLPYLRQGTPNYFLPNLFLLPPLFLKGVSAPTAGSSSQWPGQLPPHVPLQAHPVITESSWLPLLSVPDSLMGKNVGTAVRLSGFKSQLFHLVAL